MANPTPVTVEDLIDATSDINIFNDGIKTQLVSPRNLGTQRITVQLTDDPLAPRTSEGTCDADVADSIDDSTADFVTDGVAVGDTAVNAATGASALVTDVVDLNTLTLAADICPGGTEVYYIIAAADLGWYTQRDAGGEWKRSNSRTGNDASVAYVLPVNGASVVVHSVIYPILLAAIGTYPPITSA